MLSRMEQSFWRHEAKSRSTKYKSDKSFSWFCDVIAPEIVVHIWTYFYIRKNEFLMYLILMDAKMQYNNLFRRIKKLNAEHNGSCEYLHRNVNVFTKASSYIKFSS